MRVLIDCDVPAFIKSGMGVGVRGLLDELFRDQSVEFHCVFSSDAPRDGWIASLQKFPNVVVHFAQTTKRIRNIRELAGVPFCLTEIAGGRADVSVLLHPVLPHRSDAPHIAIVYDLSSVRSGAPSSVPWHGRLLARQSIMACIRQKVRLLTISDFTRMDLAEWAGISARNIGLLHLGIDEVWFAGRTAEDIAGTKAEFSLSAPYFCWSGEISRRKNVAALIEAYQQAYNRFGDKLPELVLIGRVGRGGDEIDTLPEQSGVAHKVHRVRQFLPIEKLVDIISGATGYVFPSWYEGFGLPVVEALARGVPVAVSNRTSLPEVAGPTALLFDPASLDGLRECLIKLAFCEELRGRAQTEGRLWARKFSHANSADVLRNEIVHVTGAALHRAS